jgi:hypothetical protein
MANFVYNKAREEFLTATRSMSSATIKAALLDTGAASLPAQSAADPTYANISAGVVGTPQTLGSKTVTDGIFDAADPNFGNVTGATCEVLVIYEDTGTASTSRLIAAIDTATGLPTPALSTTPVTVTFDNGANKIFKL